MAVVAPPHAPVRDDSEALIEEARRRTRRRRWRGALIVAMLLMGASIGLAAGGGGGHSGLGRRSASGSSGGAPSRSQETQEARQIARVAATDRTPEAQLLTGGTGWAMSGNGLYWTRNDGRSWSLIEPPVLRHLDYVIDNNLGNVAYRAPGYIWITLGDLIGTQVHDGDDHYATIARTTNDGKAWRYGAPPGCEYRCGSFYMSFFSASHGYLLFLDSGRQHLDETTDGGASWTTVGSAPFGGEIQFTTSSDGWGLSNPSRWINESQTPVGGGEVYRTTNGGRSWRRVHLPPPSRYAGLPATASAPAFFGTQQGVIPVRYRNPTNGKQQLVVFTTADGGRTWTAHPAPPAADLRSDQWGIAEGLAFTAPTAREWLFFAGRTLYATSDSGSSWTTVHVGIPAVAPYAISFTTPTAGWAIFSVSVGDEAYPPVLVRTTDGGRTWTALAPHS
jgi:hypothetical protein